jgi:hypothetical protein
VTDVSVFPELVTGRDDEFASRAWRVQRGSTLRGEASCDLTERVLAVPLGADERSRVVRAHELMHARVSPHGLAWATLFGDVSPRALECAEEFRVNSLLARLGFNVTLLRDGSEKVGGRRLAETGAWGDAVCFLLAVLGTGAEREYLSGIRSGNPSWLPAMRAIRKRSLHVIASCSTASLGSTRRDDRGVPNGYANYTEVLARLLSQSMAARVPRNADELRQFRRSLEAGGRRPPTGRFAPLCFAEGSESRRRPRAPGIRRLTASNSGPVMRYPSRLLTDPQQRAFARPAFRHGGIVVIDQSGSMDIDQSDLVALLRRAPNALVVGYSHRPGDSGATANAWVLASRGVVATTCPSGNVGNGVDGPILRWAIGERRGYEPVVWVTDGQVTDSHDHPDDALSEECAQLVFDHRIRMVRELTEVAGAFASRALDPSTRSNFGRVGRKMLEIRVLKDRQEN